MTPEKHLYARVPKGRNPSPWHLILPPKTASLCGIAPSPERKWLLWPCQGEPREQECCRHCMVRKDPQWKQKLTQKLAQTVIGRPASGLPSAMERAGLSAAQLAQKTGIHAFTITAYCEGRKSPFPEKLAQMARVLGVTEEELAPPSPPAPGFARSLVEGGTKPA